jgi:ubiquinone/menaquinone biosynthesis C-methylase UbiE
MNRSITNVIRFFMDECLPAIVRDNKYFMYPFFCFAYKTWNVKKIMQFKSLVYSFTEKEYEEFYTGLNTISRNRLTDINKPSIQFILDNIDKTAANLVDIGCASGYLLRTIKKEHPSLQLTGFDIKDHAPNDTFSFVKGNIEKLPFGDKSFDVVICAHTIEHIIKLEDAIKELKRIAKKQLFIITPCQRYFYYTLDEHVNFFPYKEALTSAIDMPDHRCEKIWGDWVYIGNLK